MQGTSEPVCKPTMFDSRLKLTLQDWQEQSKWPEKTVLSHFPSSIFFLESSLVCRTPKIPRFSLSRTIKFTMSESVYYLTRANCRRAEKYKGIEPFALEFSTLKSFDVLPSASSFYALAQ